MLSHQGVVSAGGPAIMAQLQQLVQQYTAGDAAATTWQPCR
jgi:hypothetical protein